jgi:alkanesulfonate monooxygenase SsuD/methylene tetrahydromethanopterin reductase-like flavin-dependent oxidoreductase (luciferase family)
LFTEKLELLLRIRESERVTWSGKFRPPLDDQAIYPRAHQQPLPVWIGVGGTPASVVRAGHLGLPVALAIIGGDPARFGTLVNLYRRSLQEAGHDPSGFPLAVHALGHVADDTKEAIEAIYPGFTETMNKIGRERGWPPLTREQFDWMAGPDGSLIVGDPETVVTKVHRWCRMLGIERFLLHTSAGNLPHQATMHSIELFGNEVAPRVRSKMAGPNG